MIARLSVECCRRRLYFGSRGGVVNAMLLFDGDEVAGGTDGRVTLERSAARRSFLGDRGIDRLRGGGGGGNSSQRGPNEERTQRRRCSSTPLSASRKDCAREERRAFGRRMRREAVVACSAVKRLRHGSSRVARKSRTQRRKLVGVLPRPSWRVAVQHRSDRRRR